ncbi:MAG: aminoacyl-tRNA hydrolase [Endomicrobium sp.]|jgi:PTH1 family peptidyl-tRNA hydrolase|nr:aminoacyl-tRNA hydrolase [Endomicrobium sp.]
MNEKIKLFVGLGNIGEKYKNTRHNIGFVILDEIAKSKQLKFTVWNNMLISCYRFVSNNVIYLLKPKTFMNHSGDAVCSFMNYKKIISNEIFVFYDDFSIPIGKYKIRMSGSSGGHNGVNSIITKIGTDNFPRMKLGIGPIPNFVKSSDYVLSKFGLCDIKNINIVMKLAMVFFDNVCTLGLSESISRVASKKYMNQCNL